jgi:hypothetical protein
LAAVLVFNAIGPAVADDLTEAAQGLCDSVKSCALEEMVDQEVTPEMREMMAPMLQNMCDTMRRKVKEVPVDHGLYAPAVGCMRSLESLTCEQYRDPDRVATPECAEYERLAKEAGVAVPAVTPAPAGTAEQ